MVATITRSKLS